MAKIYGLTEIFGDLNVNNIGIGTSSVFGTSLNVRSDSDSSLNNMYYISNLSNTSYSKLKNTGELYNKSNTNGNILTLNNTSINGVSDIFKINSNSELSMNTSTNNSFLLFSPSFDSYLVVSGNFGINNTSPAFKLSVKGSANQTNIFQAEDSIGFGILRVTSDGLFSNSGKVGIGATPSETLHVNGTVRIVDGSEGNGYILVSDSTGVASWTSSNNIGDGNGIYTGSGSLSANTTITMGANTLTFSGNNFVIDGTSNVNLFNTSFLTDSIGINKIPTLSTLDIMGNISSTSGNNTSSSSSLTSYNSTSVKTFNVRGDGSFIFGNDPGGAISGIFNFKTNNANKIFSLTDEFGSEYLSIRGGQIDLHSTGTTIGPNQSEIILRGLNTVTATSIRASYNGRHNIGIYNPILNEYAHQFITQDVGGTSITTAHLNAAGTGTVKLGGNVSYDLTKSLDVRSSGNAILFNVNAAGGVGIGNLTAAQAIALTPYNGLIVYVINASGVFTSIGFWVYVSGVWKKMTNDGIYTGSGSLSANTTITMGANTLTFSGNNFKIEGSADLNLFNTDYLSDSVSIGVNGPLAGSKLSLTQTSSVAATIYGDKNNLTAINTGSILYKHIRSTDGASTWQIDSYGDAASTDVVSVFSVAPQNTGSFAILTRSSGFTYERVRVKNNGNVGLNTSNPTENLDVNGNARFRVIGAGVSVGALHHTSTGVLTTNTSDIRLKTDINTIENALVKVNKLRGVYYRWKTDVKEGIDNRKVGFIAQEMDSVIPELAFTNKNSDENIMGVHIQDVTALLVESIKELSISNYTPSSSDDNTGYVGKIAIDNNYIYVKTDSGWRRSKMDKF